MIHMWVPIADELPEDGQDCKIMFKDETESTATYWSGLGIFCLTGVLTSFGGKRLRTGCQIIKGREMSKLLKLVQIGKRELQLSDEAYRDLLEEVTGQRSSRGLNDFKLRKWWIE